MASPVEQVAVNVSEVTVQIFLVTTGVAQPAPLAYRSALNRCLETAGGSIAALPAETAIAGGVFPMATGIGGVEAEAAGGVTGTISGAGTAVIVGSLGAVYC